MTSSLDALVAAFNRGSLDVPGRFFTPRTTFTLNGRSYESILGGSPDDPLIRLLARGAAAYRSAAKVLHYALQHPTITVESMSAPDASGARLAAIHVSGRLRGSGQPFEGRASIRFTCAGDEVRSVDVTCPDADLERIAAARV